MNVAAADPIGSIETGGSWRDNASAETEFHPEKINVLAKTWSAAIAQCDISTGTVIELRMLRVTPPRMNSRKRECPYPPITMKSALLSAA